MYINVLAAAALTGLAGRALQQLDTYAATEGPIAKAGLLANIGPGGSKAHGAKAGVVIASPSTSNPNYLYMWTRDASLVFKLLIDQYTQGENTTLRAHVDDFVGAQAVIQQVPNPSGDASSGGLGEPKFNIDETAFTAPWGRPQRDGPALRSVAIMTYASWLLDNGNATYVSSKLWPVIQLDLSYVVQNWNKITFDLWEEINSFSYFTTAVQHRALRQGALLAARLQNTTLSAQYTTTANSVLCFMQSFWNAERGYMIANTGGGRSGIDANTVLASIHTYDPTAGCDAVTFQPCSDRALANLLAYIQSFRSIYAINRNASANGAVATGRYPEDSYMGGNPWYLATAAAAEQLYDAVQVWTSQGKLAVTTVSQPFIKFLLPNSTITPGTYDSCSQQYAMIKDTATALAEGFLAVHAQYTPANGGLAEQYDKNNGAPKSALDLTWNYAAVETVLRARAGGRQASWGAQGLKVTC